MMKLIGLMQQELSGVSELMPWDMQTLLAETPDCLIVDVREVAEFSAMHISSALSVPRGILESACEWDFDETEPELVTARDKNVIVVCRSGHRSLLAAYTLQLLGFNKVSSLKTGLRGWNDFELPLINDKNEPVNEDLADQFFTSRLREDQKKPV